jgi:hypothetical protein
MLIAAAKKKLKRQTHLWEDEVTSCVFGEMRHLPASDIWAFFSRLVPTGNRAAINWPDDTPDNAEFHFWRRGKVEPDLCVDFFRSGVHQASLLIEIKWDASLSPKCELVRQWNDWRHKEIPTVHLYLVKDNSSGRGEIQQSLELLESQCASLENPCCQEYDHKRAEVKAVKPLLPYWKNRLHCLGWRDLVSLEKDMGGLGPVGRQWAKELNAFLQRYGLERFRGFDWLAEHPWARLTPSPIVLYEIEPWFSFLVTQGNLPAASTIPLFQ